MPQHHAPPASGGRPATKRQTDRRGASSGALRPVRNPVWLVGLGIFLVYCATVSGEGGSTYGQAYLTAESLVKTGDLSIDAAGSDVSVNTIGITAVNAAGERYAVTGVLWSLLLVPFYLAGQALAPLAGAGAQDIIAKLLTGLYDPLLWAVCGMLLFSLARRMSGSGTRAWVVVLLWTFATMTWGVSKYSSYLSLLSCLLLGLLWFVVLPNRSPTPLRFLGAGLCCGLLVLARTQEAVLLPACLGYLGWKALRLPPGGRVRSLLACTVPALVALGAVVWLGVAHFGSGHPLGYGSQPLAPVYVGLWGFLFSSGRSLFLFCPPLVLGLWALAKTKGAWRAERVFLACLGVTILLFYSCFRAWPGDWGDWGPRYLYPLVPLLLLPVAMLDTSGFERPFRRAVALVAVIGVLVQVPGVLLRPGAYQWPLQVASESGTGLGQVDSLFWPQFSPVFMGYRLLGAKAASALSGEPPSLQLELCDANSVIRRAVVPLDAEMLRNSDFVSHALFSLRQGAFAGAQSHLLQMAWLLRAAQGGVFVAGLFCLLWARRRYLRADAERGPRREEEGLGECR